MPSHSLTNFEIQRCYQYEPRFNGVHSSFNLFNKKKDGAYVINVDEYVIIDTHWIVLCVNGNIVTLCVSFEIEHIPKDIKNFIDNKNITTNIYRIQAYDSVMCGYFCIGFIYLMLKSKSLIDLTNYFPKTTLKIIIK